MIFKDFIKLFFSSYDREWLKNDKYDDGEYLLPIDKIGVYEPATYYIDDLKNNLLRISSDEIESNYSAYQKIKYFVDFYEKQRTEILTLPPNISFLAYLQIPRDKNKEINEIIKKLISEYPAFNYEILSSLNESQNKDFLYKVIIILDDLNKIEDFSTKINFIKNNVTVQQVKLDCKMYNFCWFVDQFNKNLHIIEDDIIKRNQIYKIIAEILNISFDDVKSQKFTYEQIQSKFSSINESELGTLNTALNLLNPKNEKKNKILLYMKRAKTEEISKIFNHNNSSINSDAFVILLMEKTTAHDLPKILCRYIVEQKILDLGSMRNFLSIIESRTSQVLKQSYKYESFDDQKGYLVLLSEIHTIILKQIRALNELTTMFRRLGLSNVDYKLFEVTFNGTILNNESEALATIPQAILLNYEHFFKATIRGWRETSQQLLLKKYGYEKQEKAQKIKDELKEMTLKYDKYFNNIDLLFTKDSLNNRFIVNCLKSTKQGKTEQLNKIIKLLKKEGYEKNTKTILTCLTNLQDNIEEFSKQKNILPKIPIIKDEKINIFFKTKRIDPGQLMTIIKDILENGSFMNLLHFFEMPCIKTPDDANNEFFNLNHIKFTYDNILYEVIDRRGVSESIATVKQGRDENLKQAVRQEILPAKSNKELSEQELIQRIIKNINFIKISYNNLKNTLSATQLKMINDIYDRASAIDENQLKHMSHTKLVEFSNVLYGDYSIVRSLTMKMNK